MISLVLLGCYLGFISIYYTSSKVTLSSTLKIERWLQTHKTFSKIIGFTILCLSAYLAVDQWGWWAGLSGFFLILLLVGSLIILTYPMKTFNPLKLLILLLFIFFIEILI